MGTEFNHVESYEPFLSFIVPVFNVKKYLADCLDSLVGQKTHVGYEIICINDGSTDGSELILYQYRQGYSNINIVNQKNQGLSAARNTGIKHAKGKYISFADSDDFIDLYMVEHVWEAAQKDPDLLIGETNSVAEDAHSRDYNRGRQDTELYLSLISSSLSMGYSWLFVIKRSLFAAHHLLFEESVPYAEDVLFNDLLLSTCDTDRAYRMNYAWYYYRQRPNSITNTVTADAWKKRLAGMTGIVYACKKYLSDYSLNTSGQERLQNRINESVAASLLYSLKIRDVNTIQLKNEWEKAGLYPYSVSKKMKEKKRNRGNLVMEYLRYPVVLYLGNLLKRFGITKCCT